ncbi:LLM class flavin-dependent oxidoreductase [Pseudonocardia kujensis]|uniref:LLM class flavin-dependent oxidoreductase n=1 Tax=Pseudonocardia kujensis TaxID=1128675 RepID=UPI003558489A
MPVISLFTVLILEASEDGGRSRPRTAPVQGPPPAQGWSHTSTTSSTNPCAAVIAAVAEQIAVFATAHVPQIRPVRLAEAAATIHHISNGRFCLTVVVGRNKSELETSGVAVQRGHLLRRGRLHRVAGRGLKKVKDRAAEKGREFRVWTQAGILCGPDQADVQRNQITKPTGGGKAQTVSTTR